MELAGWMVGVYRGVPARFRYGLCTSRTTCTEQGRVDWRKGWGKKCRAFLIGLAWTRLLSMVVDFGDGVQYRGCGATHS